MKVSCIGSDYKGLLRIKRPGRVCPWAQKPSWGRELERKRKRAKERHRTQYTKKKKRKEKKRESLSSGDRESVGVGGKTSEGDDDGGSRLSVSSLMMLRRWFVGYLAPWQGRVILLLLTTTASSLLSHRNEQGRRGGEREGAGSGWGEREDDEEEGTGCLESEAYRKKKRRKDGCPVVRRCGSYRDDGCEPATRPFPSTVGTCIICIHRYFSR